MCNCFNKKSFKFYQTVICFFCFVFKIDLEPFCHISYGWAKFVVQECIVDVWGIVTYAVWHITIRIENYGRSRKDF